jgi:hypothetical protein
MAATGALAKSRFPRSIPVIEELVRLYADYVHERDRVAEAAGCDMVFVNLFRKLLGARSATTTPRTCSTGWPGGPGSWSGRMSCGTRQRPAGCAPVSRGMWCRQD